MLLLHVSNIINGHNRIIVFLYLNTKLIIQASLVIALEIDKSTIRQNKLV